MFIGAGRAYHAAPDEYAYVHFPVSAGNGTERSCWYGNDFIILARVRRDLASLTDLSNYEFWAGGTDSDGGGGGSGDGRGPPPGGTWSRESGAAKPVFEYHHMIGAPHTFYNPGLKRYILPNYGSINTHTRLPWSETAGVGDPTAPKCMGASCPYHSTQLVLYESEHPWGTSTLAGTSWHLPMRSALCLAVQAVHTLGSCTLLDDRFGRMCAD